jgi:hypothetical protein
VIKNDTVKTKPENRICSRDIRNNNMRGRRGMRRDKNEA